MIYTRYCNQEVATITMVWKGMNETRVSLGFVKAGISLSSLDVGLLTDQYCVRSSIARHPPEVKRLFIATLPCDVWQSRSTTIAPMGYRFGRGHWRRSSKCNCLSIGHVSHDLCS